MCISLINLISFEGKLSMSYHHHFYHWLGLQHVFVSLCNTHLLDEQQIHNILTIPKWSIHSTLRNINLKKVQYRVKRTKFERSNRKVNKNFKIVALFRIFTFLIHCVDKEKTTEYDLATLEKSRLISQTHRQIKLGTRKIRL